MDLQEAVVWGLLHGAGINADHGNAFLEPVLELLERESETSEESIEAILTTPIEGIGRYRYPQRRASYIAAAVGAIRQDPPPSDWVQLRRYLERLRGIGPKTAAMIISGVSGGEAAVHVNDIWLRRALVAAGVFREDWTVERDYDRFEQAFLQYASYGDVRPGPLDWCIWELAREGG